MGGELGGQDDKLGAATYQKTVSRRGQRQDGKGSRGSHVCELGPMFTKDRHPSSTRLSKNGELS